MAIEDLKGQMARLPEQPGVYLFLGRGGETLYVGKARALRDRVRSYLGAYGTSPRHDALLDEADNLDFIVNDNDGFLSDTDSLTLRGTDPGGPNTTGDESVIVDLTAADHRGDGR